MSVLQTGFGNSGGDYTISRSVRFRASASAYFNRTPASAGNRRTFTYSGWLKRGLLDTSYNKYFFSAKPSASVRDGMYFGTGQTLSVFANDGSSALLVTTQVFRDPSAWYHVVVAVDTTQATASNRVKIYVNGTQVTSLSTATYPTQNYDWAFNNSVVHTISDDAANVPTGLYHFDGYMTEINVIDGQALTPSSFGENDTITGVWKPKRYTGTYGTNGFYLNFSDNSNNTAATIGKDSSGNGNNWTPNNISVTAGTTYDSMTDVPTMSASGSNYCVGSPLTATSGTLTNANLTYTGPSAAGGHVFGTFGISSGKYYWEATVTSDSSEIIGIQSNFTNTFADIRGYSNSDGKYYVSGAGTTYGATFTTNNVIGIALDMDAGTLTFYKDGTSQGQATSGLTGTWFPAFRCFGTSSILALNFGQRPFAYTPPTGFKALNTFNLPDSTITKGSAYFDVKARTGANGATPVSGLGFQPDFVWVKGRNVTVDHALFDSVRGASKTLYSSNTDAEATNDIYGYLSAFNSSGYSFTAGSTNIARVDSSSYNYVDWVWKESVSAGFDIVTYTGAAGAQTIAHSLGVAPSMYIVKSRSGVADWGVYHKSIGAGNALFLDLTNASTAGSVWNNTAPTSSVFSVGSGSFVNTTGVNYVAYLFAEVAGYSKFGSYVGNSSTDGTFVYTGFKPRFILHKPSSTTGQWMMWDTARNTYNVLTNSELLANSTSVEGNGGWGTQIDILSNGFKFRGSDNANFNQSGVTYVYACFAENPFKNSLAR